MMRLFYFQYYKFRFLRISDALFNIPHESTESETLGLLIHTVQFGQQGINLLITHYGKNCRTHRGPGMASIMGLASLAATSLNLREHRETAAVEVVERKEYLFLIGLVVGDKY